MKRLSLLLTTLQASPLLWMPLLFVIALLPRLAAIGRYITPDELIWVYRSVLFREALTARAWADTLITGHPGVLTTWLGSLSITLQLFLRPADQSAYEWLTHVAWYAPENTAAFSQLAIFLTGSRLLVAILNSLGLVAVYGLARRLWGEQVALLTFLLLAFDPFVAGLSGLFHVDGLLTTFVLLALIALLLYSHQFTWPYAALAGACTALATLCKSPALLLGPFTALVWLWWLIQADDRPWRHRLRILSQHGFIWLFAFLLILGLLWPALWGDASLAVDLISGNANRHIETALRPTFFMGQVTYDHGPLFYPIALAFRLSPLVVSGLLAFFWSRRHLTGKWQHLFLLGCWFLLFVVAITVAAKKFDRYALPAIPALVLMAAMAWAYLPRIRFVLPLVAALQVGWFLTVWPYPLTAYNPLVGGSAVARSVMTIGWGEGLGAAGMWLAQRPNSQASTAVTDTPPSLAPFFPGRIAAADVDSMAQADYIILSANNRQLDLDLSLPETAVLQHTLTLNGLEQAWVYRNIAPQSATISWQPTAITFGNQVQLQETATLVSPSHIDIGLTWTLVQPTNDHFNLRLQLRDHNGIIWQDQQTALLNETYFHPPHWQLGEQARHWYQLPRPPALPPSQYDIEIALFNQSNNNQLPILDINGSFQGIDYPYVTVTVPPIDTPPIITKLNLPSTPQATWLDQQLSLLTHNTLSQVTSGTPLPVDLYWQSLSPLVDDLTLQLTLAGILTETLPLSRYPTSQWRVGEIIQEKYLLTIPPQTPAGRYPLQLILPYSGESLTLTEVDVLATERLFALPADIATPLDLHFQPDIYLRGVTGPETAVSSGTTTSITLYWQTSKEPALLYTTFVHILNSDGQIVAQQDQWPSGQPSNTWATNQVIIDKVSLTLPPDLPPGSYNITVGLYLATNGQRLTVIDPSNIPYPDDRVILPFPLIVTAD